MFCPNCGKDFKSKEVNFCPYCGKNLSDFKDAELAKQSSQPIEQTIPKQLSQDHTLSKSKIANEVVDAIDKGYTPGSKSEPDKKLESTNHQSELNQKESSSVTKKLPKQRKWGLGWLIVAFIVFNIFERDKMIEENIKNAISILSLILSVSLYFIFRNRLFSDFRNIYLRSISAGFVAIVATLAVSILIIKLLPSPSQYNLYSDFSHQLTYIQDKYTNEANVIDEKMTVIQSTLVISPANGKDYQQNINSIDAFLPLALKRFSITKKAIIDFQVVIDKYANRITAIPLNLFPTKSLYQDLLFVYDELGIKTANCYFNLKVYYNVLIKNEKNADIYYNNFEKLSTEVETLAFSAAKMNKEYMINHIDGIITYLRKQKYLH